MGKFHRPGGAFRRRIVLDASGTHVHAALEDDFHHFVVELELGDGVVTAVQGRALRHPWGTCPGATDRLRAFLGQPVATDIIRRKDVTDPAQQCTHQHDLTVLAIARAARGPGRTVYAIDVPDRPDRQNFPRVEHGFLLRAELDGHTTATLDQDGARVLAWSLEGRVITAPPEMAGVDFRTIGRWADAHGVDDTQLERMKVLRQGIFVAGGRAQDVDAVTGAFSSAPRSKPACYVFQPERVKQGLRVVGSTLDFTDRRDALLVDEK